MSEEDLELLITLDDPGEDALEEDTFNHFQADARTGPVSRTQQGGDPTSEQKSLLIMTPPSWLADKLGSSAEHVP
jgi:hypothetical protein